jgi:ribosomal protein S27E
MLVTKNTRAKKDGTYIGCPSCPNMQRVYHFAWSELTCTCCKKSVPKQQWELVNK